MNAPQKGLHVDHESHNVFARVAVHTAGHGDVVDGQAAERRGRAGLPAGGAQGGARGAARRDRGVATEMLG